METLTPSCGMDVTTIVLKKGRSADHTYYTSFSTCERARETRLSRVCGHAEKRHHAPSVHVVLLRLVGEAGGVQWIVILGVVVQPRGWTSEDGPAGQPLGSTHGETRWQRGETSVVNKG